MKHELAKRLKAAGWIFDEHAFVEGPNDTEWFNNTYAPTLEELIEACEKQDGFYALAHVGRPEGEWSAIGQFGVPQKHGATPIEAVANLYLALHAPEVTKELCHHT